MVEHELVKILELVKNNRLAESFAIWKNVYRRIRFFKKMYPLSAIIKDMFLFPMDYLIDGRDINVVRNLQLIITHKCNIRCEMCYFHKELHKSRELPFEHYKLIIDSTLKQHPCLLLSGGEPFTHPRLIDMVAYAKARGLAVQIFTNGTLVKPEIIDKLVELDLDYINFSLLGNEQTHPLVAKSPNSYNLFIKHLEYFTKKRKNTKIILNFTINHRSISDLNHPIELAKRYNLDGVRYQHYNFLTDNEINSHKEVMNRCFNAIPDYNQVQDDEIAALSNISKSISDFMLRLKSQGNSIPLQWAPTLIPAELDKWYTTGNFVTSRKCLYPWRGILVDADAKVYPCAKIYLELGTLDKEGVFGSWNGPVMKQFRRRLKRNLFPACARCCKL